MPILFVTGFANGGGADGGLDGEDALQKPFTAQSLLACVHDLLARRARA
jgi:DNA-binding response OmpR family regulator